MGKGKDSEINREVEKEVCRTPSPLGSLTQQEVDELANEEGYAGTSKGPNFPLIAGQMVIFGDEADVSDEGDEKEDIEKRWDGKKLKGVKANFFPPRQDAVDPAVYHPSFEVIGTAYVHGAMNGEVKEAYSSGGVSLKTFLVDVKVDKLIKVSFEELGLKTSSKKIVFKSSKF